ncbi:hypothetical protein K445DRAFT_186291 [Daldinia sp. EC12]|nr:hypothetical protein K445DRAFT_186291 [Daldinia sp. EC12]
MGLYACVCIEVSWNQRRRSGNLDREAQDSRLWAPQGAKENSVTFSHTPRTQGFGFHHRLPDMNNEKPAFPFFSQMSRLDEICNSYSRTCCVASFRANTYDVPYLLTKMFFPSEMDSSLSHPESIWESRFRTRRFKYWSALRHDSSRAVEPSPHSYAVGR